MKRSEQDIRFKVCGMRDSGNILTVASLTPHYMGFIFYPPSPRFVGNDFSVPGNLGKEIKRVGVFVNENTENILRTFRSQPLDYVQLHGQETVDECRELKDEGVKVIKVFSVDDTFDFQVTKAYRGHTDFFLFDTKGIYFGGNARAFKWEILKKYDQEVPFFLSGGLSEENIASLELLKGMNLHAVDVNSGVEEYPGMKSADKLGRFLEALYGGGVNNT